MYVSRYIKADYSLGGTTVNGVYAPPPPFGLEKTDRPY
jgi:hypothetical protein